MKDVVAGVALVICALCVVLVTISVIHDLSDGKVDGAKYVNGCDQ